MKYLLVEIETDMDSGPLPVPLLTYLGEFTSVEDAVAARIQASRNNPGMAFSLNILAVLS
jgi:hypothetical protein